MKRYFFLQLKRMAASIPYLFVYLLLIVVGAGGVLALLQKKNTDAADMQKIPIGIVGNTEETYFNIAFTALQKLDSTKHTIELYRMRETAAKEALRKGELMAYAVIPDGFAESVLVGKNKQIVFVTTNASRDLGNRIVEELTAVISNLLVETQNAIYGMQNLAEEKQVQYDQSAAVQELNLQYIDLVLNRPDFFAIEYLAEGSAFSWKTYYGCAFFVAILSFWGMGCVMFAVQREVALMKLFRVRGYSVATLVLGEYLAYTAWLFVGASIVLSIFCAVGLLDGIGIELFLAGIPVVVALAAFQFFLYEWADSVISAVLWQFITAVIGCYVTGCFYPIAFFPETVQHLAQYVPQGAALQYMQAYQNGTAYGKSLFLLILYIIVCLSVTIVVRMGKVAGTE